MIASQRPMIFTTTYGSAITAPTAKTVQKISIACMAVYSVRSSFVLSQEMPRIAL